MRDRSRLPPDSGRVSSVVGRVASSCRGTTAVAIRKARAFVCGAAFWTAVLLPLAYLPLVATGFSPLLDLPVLGSLVALNVVALVVGQFHEATGQAYGT